MVRAPEERGFALDVTPLFISSDLLHSIEALQSGARSSGQERRLAFLRSFIMMDQEANQPQSPMSPRRDSASKSRQVSAIEWHR